MKFSSLISMVIALAIAFLTTTMTAVTKSAHAFAGFVSRIMFWMVFPLFTYLVQQKVPRKTKRQLFLSSVFALFCRINDPSPSTVKGMMSILLCRQPVASLGVLLKSYTWQKFDEEGILVRTDILHPSQIFGTPSNRHLDERDKLILAKEMLKHVPGWLKYGSSDLMMADIVQLLGQVGDNSKSLAIAGHATAGA